MRKAAPVGVLAAVDVMRTRENTIMFIFGTNATIYNMLTVLLKNDAVNVCRPLVYPNLGRYWTKRGHTADIASAGSQLAYQSGSHKKSENQNFVWSPLAPPGGERRPDEISIFRLFV